MELLSNHNSNPSIFYSYFSNQPNNQYIPDQFNQIHQNLGQLFAQQTNLQPSYQSYQQPPYGQPNMQPPFGQPYGQPYGQANIYGHG